MPKANDDIAAQFSLMADLIELHGGNRFRVNAYQRAARTIGRLSDDVATMTDEELAELDGIGKGTVANIREYLDNDSIDDIQKLNADTPPGLPPLLAIPGLGPKTLRLLWQELDVTDKDSLAKALDGDKVAKLKGMGEKKVDKLKKSLAFTDKSQSRVRLGTALPLAQWVAHAMRQMPGVAQSDYAGSVRRGCETIGDVDIVTAVTEDDRDAVGEAFTQLPVVDEIIAKGNTKVSVRTDEGINIDLRMIDPESYGAALLYFTGSKEHNVRLRSLAGKADMKLNEYGLYDADEKRVAASTEADIYDALDLNWIPPTLREDHGEVAAASRATDGNLPTLIQLADLQAELHAHTHASDGRWSIRELALAAAELGYHTVAITDHSKSQVQANGLTNERLEQHIANVRQVAEDLKDQITVLAGSEVDILTDGKLDYSRSLLDELDIVVASPHAALTQDRTKATTRLRRAIDHPCVTILGHPTGRLVQRRPGLDPDMKELVKAAAKRGIAMEINANSYRLDLRDTHARMAIEAGVKLAINTDAHGPNDLDQRIFGILTAQRAGAAPENVVNTFDHDALHEWIKSTRN